MMIGLLPDGMKPRIHCVTTHWIRGFMTFQLGQRTRSVVLMVPVRLSPVLGKQFTETQADLGVIVAAFFYDNVIKQHDGQPPASARHRRLRFQAKESIITAWVHLAAPGTGRTLTETTRPGPAGGYASGSRARGMVASSSTVEPAGRVTAPVVRSRRRPRNSPSPSGTVASRR